MDQTELEKELTKKLQKRLCPSWHELRYNEKRHKPYLVGKKKETDEVRNLCLVNGSMNMNFQGLKTHIRDSGSSNITLAIYCDDSTSVFYKCQMGLKSLFLGDQTIKSTEKSGENG
ncbi:sen15 domain-containing protein [Trichonephila inaurata madagascariensis]|uniref:Sen15 domain-containing protein n=1 Tax=Trichonephila inaurata madagascariensis TaxID=2747483 RepID=A0A8X6WRG6_9ARAC|nr:sen15 domain-containing protein [Trichonephila inaurata madagascariensis]